MAVNLLKYVRVALKGHVMPYFVSRKRSHLKVERCSWENNLKFCSKS